MTLLYEPFAPLLGLSRDSVFAPGTTGRSFLPPADVVVTDEDVTVAMDVPGFKVDDLDITLTGDVLTIRGERAFPYAANDDGRRVWQRLERGFGRFERIVQVPDGLDAGTITASIRDGVLTLHIPKPEARKPKRIEIAPGGGQPAAVETTEHRELVGAAG